MAPNTKKVILELVIIFGKSVFSGLMYALVAKVWRM